MNKTKKISKIGRRGKTMLAVLIAVMFVSVATAALLTHYGKVETTVNVKQAMRLDGMFYSTGYGDITADDEIGNIVAGNCEWGKDHWLSLHSGAQNPVDVTVEKWSNAYQGEFTTFIAGEVDAGPGTYVAPTSWDIMVDGAPIQTAIDGAEAGDVIGVKAGIYDEDVVIDKGLTLAALEPGVTILRGVQITSSGVILQGFAIETDLVYPKACVFLGPALSDVEVSYNDLDGESIPGTRGVETTIHGDYTNVIIANNVIHDLNSGIYTNPHTGNIDIFYNEFYDCEAGIGGLTGANVRRNTFHNNGEAIGTDTSTQNYVIKYNNFLGDDAVVKYGAWPNYDYNPPAIIAHDNWWGYDGIDVEGNVDATWFEWQDGHIVELQPGERKDFKIQYCAAGMGVGDGFTASVSFK